MNQSKLIGIDPGHGGHDPGAVGLNGLKESEVTLSIAKRVEAYLVAAGQGVVMTRQEDAYVALLARTALLNQQKVDIAISVHINASTNRTANYVATFIQGPGGQAEVLAKHVQPRLVAATGWKDGGIRVQNLHMTRETRMPAILVEVGFISNPEQESQLRAITTRDKLARAVADGVLEYLGIANTGVKVAVNGQVIPATLIEGKTYAPVRALAEAMGRSVTWDEKTKTVHIG